MNNFTLRQQQEPGCPARWISQAPWVISVLSVPSSTDAIPQILSRSVEWRWLRQGSAVEEGMDRGTKEERKIERGKIANGPGQL